jgi:hypothetical protein
MDEDFAIVVGIDSYPKLPPLSSAVADATAFAEWLRKPDGGGITEQSRLEIIVSPEKQDPQFLAPLQSRIDNALKKFGVGKGHIIGRRLYVYFSGHGVGIDFDDVALLMANASMTELDNNIGLRSYRSFFHVRDLFEQIVFILDCCRDRVKHLKIRSTAPDITVDEDDELPEVVDYVFMATSHGQGAFAVPKGNGLLTEAMIEGLDGAAAIPTGEITSLSLRDYIKNRIPVLAKEKKIKKAQTLNLDDDPQGKKLVFRKVRNKVTVKIYAAPGITGELAIFDANFKEIERRDIATFNKNNPWTLDLMYSSVPFPVLNLNTGTINRLNLGLIKDDNYEFQFSIPK